MTRVSQQLGQEIPGTEYGLFGMRDRYNHDSLIGAGIGTSCLITGKGNPRQGGFRENNGHGYFVSSDAVTSTDGLKGIITHGNVFGDAILDAELSPDIEETTIQTIVQNFEYGIRSAIGLERKNTSKETKDQP